MNDSLFHTERYGYSVDVVYDEEPESPREWDNLGKFLLDGHRRYSFPVETSHEDLKKAKVVLPVYMYDHSGIVISTTPFNDPWDSGKLGYVAAFSDDIRKFLSCKRITNKVLENVKEYLQSEVETYNDYINGDVYQIIVKNLKDDCIEECIGGYYGLDYAIDEAKQMIDCYKPKYVQLEFEFMKGIA